MQDADVKEIFSAIKMLKDKLDEHQTRIEELEKQIKELKKEELAQKESPKVAKAQTLPSGNSIEKRPSFEELLKEFLPNKEENSGEKISKGIIRAIRKEVIIVDVGLKSDGVILASEFTPEELANLKVNDEIEVVVENWDGHRGMSLSRG